MPTPIPPSSLPEPTRRRSLLGLLGALGSLPLVGCGAGPQVTDDSSDDSSTSTTDATLAALEVSQGSLSPAFDSATTSYTVSVTYSVETLTLTAEATASGASVTVNGVLLADSAGSLALTLSVGTNTVSVVVSSADGASTTTYTVSIVRAAAGSAGNCALIPSEVEGPYPLLAILSNSGIVRDDIREDRTGVPLSLTLTLQNINDSCAAVKNAAVYIWHCDKDGAYSGYSSTTNGNHLNESFLRGVQLTDSNGQVSFTTIYPGWYAGRITHIHFQVYLNDNLAVTATVTSQIAFPQAVTKAVYDSDLYADRGQNTSVTDFAYDNIFSDGTSLQMATISGDTTTGYAASLVVGLAI